jgi:hypothetical protein
MRTLRRNKRKLKYALLDAKSETYARDADGNIIYIEADGQLVPVTEGQISLSYSAPVEFDGNISVNNGETKMVEYGIDDSNYDATLVVDLGSTPLVEETTLIWYESEVGYKDIEHTVIDEDSADYRVAKRKPSLNEMKYLLKKVSKNHEDVQS